MAFEYEDVLKDKLSRLRVVSDDLDKLSKEKDELRAQVKKWMELMELIDHNVTDSDGFPWSLKITSSERKSVGDWDKLKSVLSQEQWDLLIKITNTTTFTARKVKTK